MDFNADIFKKSKNVWSAVIVLEILLVGGFIYKVYQPRKRKINELKTRISQEQLILQKYRKKIKNFGKVKAEADSIEQLWNKLNQILPSQSEVPRWIKKIALMGLRNGLEFTMFKPLPISVKGFYSIYPLEIDLLGTYKNFGKFVEDLTNSPQVTKITNLDIVSFKSKDYPEFSIKAHFTLQIYVFSGTKMETLLNEGK